MDSAESAAIRQRQLVSTEIERLSREREARLRSLARTGIKMAVPPPLVAGLIAIQHFLPGWFESNAMRSVSVLLLMILLIAFLWQSLCFAGECAGFIILSSVRESRSRLFWIVRFLAQQIGGREMPVEGAAKK
jgi:hypothetical protein